MAKPQYQDLIDEIANLPDGGPTVADEVQREKLLDLATKVLEALSKPAPAPVVNVKVPDFPKAVAPQVTVPAPVVHVQPAPKVLDWTFTFEHNPNGSIKSIRARATKE